MMTRMGKNDQAGSQSRQRGKFPFRLSVRHLGTIAILGFLAAGIANTVLRSTPLAIALVGVAVLAAALVIVTMQSTVQAANPRAPRATTCGTCGEPVAASPDQIIIRGEAYCDDRCASLAW